MHVAEQLKRICNSVDMAQRTLGRMPCVKEELPSRSEGKSLQATLQSLANEIEMLKSRQERDMGRLALIERRMAKECSRLHLSTSPSRQEGAPTPPRARSTTPNPQVRVPSVGSGSEAVEGSSRCQKPPPCRILEVDVHLGHNHSGSATNVLRATSQYQRRNIL